MAQTSKKRNLTDAMEQEPLRSGKKAKKQADYDSSSSEGSEEETPMIPGQKASHNDTMNGKPSEALTESDPPSLAPSDALEDSTSDSDSEATSVSETTSTGNKRRKRNDPDAFATSMSKILGSKLSTSKRSDPVLARSKVAEAANRELHEERLEVKARHKLRDEKRAQLDKGRVRDVLGVEGGDGGLSAAEALELERRLKKTAQRGVVKLFNAVRAAQVKAEEAQREALKAGVVGAKSREEKINEMSKKGFLELIAGGGSMGQNMVPEEA